jgi:predicted small secreted protein
MTGQPRLKRLISLLGFLGAVVAVLAGCNTMAGLGKDMEELGARIKREAKQ